VVSRLCETAAGAARTDAGPVQLNVPLREPLVPDLAGDLAGGSDWPESLDGRDDDVAPWVTVQPAGIAAQAIACIPRTLVVLGDLPDPATAADVVRLAAASGWPVIAEPFGAHDRSGVIPHGPLLLTAGDWLGRHRPDRVVVVGRVTSPGRWEPSCVTRRSRWRSSQRSRAGQIPGTSASVVHPFEAVTASIPMGRQVDEHGRRSGADTGELVAKEAEPVIRAAWPSGLAIAAAVLAELPSGATLFVGSSNSARDVDLAMSPAVRSAPLTIVASRGLAGIDGCVSTAIGLALTQPGRPAYALMGDLTFLHDTNALLIGPHEPVPDLTIVVTNDDGGGIFTLLEPGEPGRAASFERVFGTPTGASIVDVCRAHGVRHSLVATEPDLRAVLVQNPHGLRVVEVEVDRGGHRDLHARLRAAAARALQSPV
jgi:2-succinyl-5-enolpyruvyl-6-hydroxy-3-cyclohexene-1-carboxylate synthase